MASRLLSVVVPVYRSERYLERTARELVAALDAAGEPFELVLVNDGSPDGVQEVVERLAAADARVRFVQLGGNVGQHRATLVGLAAARGDVAVTIDDDGQNPPAAALAVARALRERDLDVVYGAFAVRRQGRLRAAASRVNRWLSRHVLGNVRDVELSNVRAIRGELARVVGASPSGYPYVDALLFRATRRIDHVRVEHRPREDGGSTYSLRALVRLWISHLTTLSVLPLKVATAGAFGASLLGLGLGVLKLVQVLHDRQAPAGWLSLFLAVTFLFSVLFAFLGILSAYLGRMYVSQNERGLVWTRASSDGPARDRSAAG